MKGFSLTTLLLDIRGEFSLHRLGHWLHSPLTVKWYLYFLHSLSHSLLLMRVFEEF